MSTGLRPVAVAGAALIGVGALIAATPTVAADSGTASAFDAASVSATFELLSRSDVYGEDSDDDDYGDDDGSSDSDDDRDDDDDDDGWGAGNFIADFLANNQADVLAVTAMIPTIYLGPVAVGNSLLATAYYNGYDGSAAGVDGVIAYVTSQIGVPPANIVQGLVLGLTSLVPQFSIGPVAVGNSLLATAYFNGYDGSATGLPGVISYVTSQLEPQVVPGAAAVSAVDAPIGVKAPEVASVAVSRSVVAALAASQDGDSDTVSGGTTPVSVVDDAAEADSRGNAASAAESKTDGPSAGRSAGRSTAPAKVAGAGGQTKARSHRSAAR